MSRALYPADEGDMIMAYWAWGFTSPVAFRIGPLAFRWYGLAMATAVLLGWFYYMIKGKSQGMEEDQLASLAFWCIIGGVVGARLLFVLVNFPQWFWQDFWQVFRIYEGGLAWHGALLGGVLGGLLGLRRMPDLAFGPVADLVVPALALGYGLVRITNIANEEVLGRATMWGFSWPAQLIGSTIGFVLLARHFMLVNRTLPPSYLFWSFLFYHQMLRAIIEETVRQMPLIFELWVSPAWGMALLTPGQLSAIPILLGTWWMMKRAGERREAAAD